MNTLCGGSAIVTGAGSGIGRAFALLVAERGAPITVADLVPERPELVAEEIRTRGGRAIAFTADVADESQIREMVEATLEAHGGVDILHNNAGDVRQETMQRDLRVDMMDIELWEHVMHVNLRGAMLVWKWVISEVLKGGRGLIVKTSSHASLGGRVATVVDGTAKSGVIGLTQYIATTYGRQRIRCNAVLAGLIMSPAAH